MNTPTSLKLRTLHTWLRSGLSIALALCLTGWASVGSAAQADASDDTQPAGSRQGYLVQVDLPLIGDRDDSVRRQILRIADASANADQRPVVVLQFQAKTLDEMSGDPDSSAMSTRGSQFERCLALARFLTSSEASRVRLIAYLPKSVEGHAVLPVLACEEILCDPSAELGRATIDEPVDPTIEGAYRDIATRRATLPVPVVSAMLDPRVEVYALQLADGTSLFANRDDAEKLRDEGKVLSEETIWQGGAMAAFSGQQMRTRRWVARTISDYSQLTSALGVSGSLRTAKQLPREWRPIGITISGPLLQSRVNQIIRGLREQIEDKNVNLVVFRIERSDSDYQQATRLASFVAGLDPDEVYTVGIVRETVSGPLGLVAVACREAVLISDASLGPSKEDSVSISDGDSTQRFLDDLSTRTGRPLSLLSVLVDHDVVVQEFINQTTGRRAAFADWQVAQQADADQWLAKQTVAGGEAIPSDVATKYRLVDSVDESEQLALSRLGVESSPSELKSPWLDSSIQTLLAQGWLPRLLLTLGFFALMAELGSPGLGIGGFLASVCFLGFFWIEGLNGNVEALEIILFIAGLICLALELFVVPGFGIFGIGGLLMLFVSVVLAGQTFVWPTTSAQLGEVSVNLFWTACLALGGMIGLLFMHKQLERLPMFKWVTLQPDDDDDLDYRESLSHREHLAGQTGLTTTRLNPSGKAQFGDDIVQVVGSGRLINEGVPVRVVEVRGNLIIVEETALESVLQ